ncbi:hypothetical protein FB451DRAFT_1143991 [Mycena latifolia]|nr:hypothetical protein FB451DRAFT_1143991 [Mycena latifolia]
MCTPNSCYFNPQQPLVVVDGLTVETRWRPLSDDEQTTSPSPSPRSPSPARSHACSTAASDDSEGDSCWTAPSVASSLSSTFIAEIKIPTLTITSKIQTGVFADVARGSLCTGDQISPVTIKTYNAAGLDELVAEITAYGLLADLQGSAVAAQIGIVAPLHWAWVGLLMEDVGPSLGSGERWEGLALQEKKNIYDTLVTIHQKGVEHGDVAPRNVVRRPGGGIVFIDFGNAKEHSCPGTDTCSELQRLLCALVF